MKRILMATAAVFLATATLAGAAEKYAKPGFFVHVHDGRLWVLREGDKDVALVSKNKEPKEVTTRIGAGPNGMTIRSNKGEVIDAYMAAK